MSANPEAFPGERQRLITERLAMHGRVIAADLAAEFKVSEHSIRRDLGALAASGVCKRVYGGAISLASDGPISARIEHEPQRKRTLGVAGAGLISAGQHVFIDGGSTNLAIARAIDPQMTLTVTTNAPVIAVELMKLPCVEVILLGGRLSPVAGSTYGHTTIQQLTHFNFDLCFLGACALDAMKGVTAFDLDVAEFKRAVVARSGQVVVAVINEKLASIAHYQVASCEDVGALVVEHDAPEDRLELFRGKVAQLVKAQAGH
ncbi:MULTISPECIES: DeoR/GlpR family DNA-binding transcription regulator [unclassified Pseudomonas]|uniref:DeoR/GlpR family DNA-binding transcription regulator n=1 Tax=unclassified Pseudomonas TaxID=196821 RepID=UPI000D3969F5|nr:MULTISPECIES: DeoR/GlpR family DNA-binding transcription regulator [unclassified Pseudomonas]RAU47446.1 DeoR/GlpR transcriptional regulator [Pseudomonas sp. RIT 409]RAU51879.1 DeoR/GlpR transcriptional regulator [Pseudomonas sp. RIT 412]